MSILAQHTHFRRQFAIKGSTSASLTFVSGSPDTITRAAGDFTADGHLADHSLDVVGTTNNDGRWPVASVAALTITLTTSTALTNEGPVACTLTSSFIDDDGYDRWPLTYVRLAGSGFGAASGSGNPGSTITGVPTPYAGSPFTVTCNAVAADAVRGVDEYRWYLSQRTDTPASQHLDIYQLASTPTQSFSGTVRIVHTALAQSAFGFTGSSDFTPDMVPLLFRNCHLYVQRISDNAIQWVDLLRAMTSEY